MTWAENVIIENNVHKGFAVCACIPLSLSGDVIADNPSLLKPTNEYVSISNNNFDLTNYRTSGIEAAMPELLQYQWNIINVNSVYGLSNKVIISNNI